MSGRVGGCTVAAVAAVAGASGAAGAAGRRYWLTIRHKAPMKPYIGTAHLKISDIQFKELVKPESFG